MRLLWVLNISLRSSFLAPKYHLLYGIADKHSAKNPAFIPESTMPFHILPVRAEDIHIMTLLRLAALEKSPSLGPIWHQLRGKCARLELISTQEKTLRDDFTAALSAPNRKYLKVVDSNGPDAEIVSYCQWHGPVEEEWEIIQGAPKAPVAPEDGTNGENKMAPAPKSATLAMAEGANVEALIAINAEEVAMNERMWRKDKVRCFRKSIFSKGFSLNPFLTHPYRIRTYLKRSPGLTNLMTHPKYQGRGAASLLVRHGLALADIAHLPTVLQADPDGYNIYKKFGFEDFGVWQVDLTKFGAEGIVHNTGMVRKARF